MKGSNDKLLVENKKPTETVQELKDEYKVPSFEEFMKTYEADDKVNKSYEKEIDSCVGIGIGKGYGPCPEN